MSLNSIFFPPPSFFPPLILSLPVLDHSSTREYITEPPIQTEGKVKCKGQWDFKERKRQKYIKERGLENE